MIYYLPFDDEALATLFEHLPAYDDCCMLNAVYVDGWYRVELTAPVPDNQIEHLQLLTAV